MALLRRMSFSILARSREELDQHMHAEERSEEIVSAAVKVMDQYRKLASEISAAKNPGVRSLKRKSKAS